MFPWGMRWHSWGQGLDSQPDVVMRPGEDGEGPGGPHRLSVSVCRSVQGHLDCSAER